MATARGYAAEGVATPQREFSAALLFLTASLRTRLGFAEAARRLGGTPLDVHELRFGPAMSDAESFGDTLRTITGMTDVVVARTPFKIDRELVSRTCVAPLVNGGDADEDHPTQTLVDLFAIGEQRGDVAELAVGLCGDLGMRSARSLLKLLNRLPPKSLRLIAPPSRSESRVALSEELESRTMRTQEADFTGLDVLYMVGLPAGTGSSALTREARAAFALDRRSLARLPEDAVVFSPLPVIDEIAEESRMDPRIRMFRQSDDGVWVRAAVLDFVLGGS
jgi:aspartate carbamoyltransferase catalytic subunit